MKKSFSVFLAVFCFIFIAMGIVLTLPGTNSYKEDAYRFFTSADAGISQPVITAVRGGMLRFFVLAGIFYAGLYFAGLSFNTVKKQNNIFVINTILIKLRI